MISRFISRWRSKDPEGSPQAPASAVGPSPGATGEAPTSAHDVLGAYLEESGGESAVASREVWGELATRINVISETYQPQLTAFPPLACQLLNLLQDPDVDVNNLVRLIHQDLAVTTSLLSISNSVAYSPSSPITTVRDAVQLMGTQRVSSIAIGVSTRSVFNLLTRKELAVYPDLLRAVHHDAVTDAFTSGWLANSLRVRAPDQAFVAGLLGELGRLVALQIVSHAVVEDGLVRPPEAMVIAAIDDVAALVGTRAVATLKLPDELCAACQVYVADAPLEASVGRLVSGIGAIARRSPVVSAYLERALKAADQLGCQPRLLRNVIKQRIDDSVKAKVLVH